MSNEQLADFHLIFFTIPSWSYCFRGFKVPLWIKECFWWKCLYLSYNRRGYTSLIICHPHVKFHTVSLLVRVCPLLRICNCLANISNCIRIFVVSYSSIEISLPFVFIVNLFCLPGQSRLFFSLWYPVEHYLSKAARGREENFIIASIQNWIFTIDFDFIKELMRTFDNKKLPVYLHYEWHG